MTVILHENGHVLGLDPPTTPARDVPVLPAGRLHAGQDDINGIRALYP